MIIAGSEDEIIVRLFHEYLITHERFSFNISDQRMSVKSFADYIQQYLIDYYNLDEEETDA